MQYYDKKFSLSGVNWIGIATILISILSMLMQNDFIMQYPNAVSLIGLLVGILTIIVRYFDANPVRLPFKKPNPHTSVEYHRQEYHKHK